MMRGECTECEGRDECPVSEENEESKGVDNEARDTLSDVVLSFIGDILMCCNVAIVGGLFVAGCLYGTGILVVSDSFLIALILTIGVIAGIGVVIRYWMFWKDWKE